MIVMSNPAVENPPSIVVKIANTVFALGIVFSIVAVAFSGYRITSVSDAPESLQFYQLTLLAGLIGWVTGEEGLAGTRKPWPPSPRECKT